MHKEVERAVLRITQAMEKNRDEYLNVKRSYADTGYDRYWNKMQRLDIEYEELKSFLHPKEKREMSSDEYCKLKELQIAVKNLRSKWEYLRHDLPDSASSIGIDEIFKDVKTLLG